MGDHPFRRAAKSLRHGAELKSTKSLNLISPAFAGARPRTAAAGAAVTWLLCFLLSSQSRQQIRIGLAIKIDE